VRPAWRAPQQPSKFTGCRQQPFGISLDPPHRPCQHPGAPQHHSRGASVAPCGCCSGGPKVYACFGTGLHHMLASMSAWLAHGGCGSCSRPPRPSLAGQCPSLLLERWSGRLTTASTPCIRGTYHDLPNLPNRQGALGAHAGCTWSACKVGIMHGYARPHSQACCTQRPGQASPLCCAHPA